MYKKSIFVLFMFFLFLSVSGQNHTDSIQVVKAINITQYRQSGEILNFKDFEIIFRMNQTSTNYLKSAKTLNMFSNIISSSGGFLIGYPIGYGIKTGHYNMTLVAVGCGLAIISIPISMASKNKLKMAVDNYNSRLNSNGSIDNYDLKLGFTQTGIGLTLTL
ncbi:MAG: hypothetical protein Q7U47_14275 [Paludibacter sp.]|nr:hypothetical protein [Paludibacter sp.]